MADIFVRAILSKRRELHRAFRTGKGGSFWTFGCQPQYRFPVERTIIVGMFNFIPTAKDLETVKARKICPRCWGDD